MSLLSDLTGIHIGWNENQRGFDMYLSEPGLGNSSQADNSDWWFGENSAAAWLLPTHGTGWFTHDQSKANQKAGELKSTTQDAMGGLQEQLDSYMGPTGFLQRQKSIREDKLSQTYDSGMRSISSNQSSFVDSIANQRGKSDLAYSGSTTRRENLGLNEFNNQRLDTSTNFQLNMRESQLTAERERIDTIGAIREKMNNLLATYTQATDKGLSETGQFRELKNQLDEYAGGT